MERLRLNRMTYSSSGETKTTLPVTCPLSMSALAFAASKIGNLAARMGSILRSSSRWKSATQSYLKSSTPSLCIPYPLIDFPFGSRSNRTSSATRSKKRERLCGPP